MRECVFLWFRWPDPSDYNTICLQSAWLQLIFRESSLKMRSSTCCCCLNITPALTCAPPAPRPGHAPLRHGHLNAPSLGLFFLGGGVTFASCCCFRTNSFRGGESVCVCAAGGVWLTSPTNTSSVRGASSLRTDSSSSSCSWNAGTATMSLPQQLRDERWVCLSDNE